MKRSRNWTRAPQIETPVSRQLGPPTYASQSAREFRRNESSRNPIHYASLYFSHSSCSTASEDEDSLRHVESFGAGGGLTCLLGTGKSHTYAVLIMRSSFSVGGCRASWALGGFQGLTIGPRTRPKLRTSRLRLHETTKRLGYTITVVFAINQSILSRQSLNELYMLF